MIVYHFYWRIGRHLDCSCDNFLLYLVGQTSNGNTTVCKNNCSLTLTGAYEIGHYVNYITIIYHALITFTMNLCLFHEQWNEPFRST